MRLRIPKIQLRMSATPSASPTPSGSKSPSPQSSKPMAADREKAKSKGKAKFERCDSDTGLPTSPTTEEDIFNIAVLERDEEFRYGWSSCRPWFLQWCLHPVFVLFSMCFSVMIQMFGVYGIFPSITRQLQNHFHISLTGMAMIRMMYDVGYVVALIPLLYLESTGANRPFWLCLGQITLGFGMMLTTVPNFIQMAELKGPPTQDVCQALNDTCPRLVDPQMAGTYFWIFMAALFICGLGSAPIFAMGLAFIDENVTKEISTVYTGVFHICAWLGPAFGLLTTSGIGKHELGKDRNETQYWWVPMAGAASVSFLLAAIISAFPYRLPTAVRMQVEEILKRMELNRRRCIAGIGSNRPDKVNSRSKQVLLHCSAVLRNPTFLGLLMDYWMFNWVATGFLYFLPIYMRLVFRSRTYQASQLSALVTIAAVVSLVGCILLQHSLRLGIRGNLRLSVIAAVVGMIAGGAFFVKCHEPHIAGLKTTYPIYGDGNWTGPVLVDKCNNRSDCPCNENYFKVVCYVTTGNRPFVEMYSGCYAGCRNKIEKPGEVTVLINCSCVPGNITYQSGGVTWKGDGSVLVERCVDDCPATKLWAFMIGLCWFVMSLFARVNAVNQGMLRCVTFNQRGIALALAALLARIFGAIPSVPVVGFMAHSSCIYKQLRCDKRSLCAWWNARDAAHFAGIMSYVLMTIGLIGLTLAVVTHKRKMDAESIKKRSTLPAVLPAAPRKGKKVSSKMQK